MRHFTFLLLFVASSVVAQINNWDPTPKQVDSSLVFQDDLDFYLNAYSREEIKAMRAEVNVWHMNFDKLMKATIKDIMAYSEGGNIDPRRLDFSLLRADDGRVYHLDAHAGKIRAFMFVSMSNPPARAQLPRWDKLLNKYDTALVELFVIYGKELHPGDKKRFRMYPLPTTDAEKQAYATAFTQLTRLPVLVDDLSNTVLDQYGRVPNGSYVIDAHGKLIFRSTWADSRKIEQIIDTVLKWRAQGSRVWSP